MILCLSLLSLSLLHLVPGVFGEQNGKPVEGRPFTLSCSYPPRYKTNTKYFSKVVDSTEADLIRTSIHNTLVRVGGLSLYDDTSRQQVRVTFDAVKSGDAGQYMTGIDITLLPDPTCRFQLEVQKAPIGKGKLQRDDRNSTHQRHGNAEKEDLVGQTSIWQTAEMNVTTMTNHHSAGVDGANHQFESWFSLPILVCVCALLIVCVFSLLLLFKLHCSTEHDEHNIASISLSYRVRPRSSQTSDYETMNSVLGDNTTQSSVAVESAAPSDAETSIPIYAEVQRRSHVYQNLRADTLQEAIYYNLDVPANKHVPNVYQEPINI
ncbi:uncharacterized protein LOC121719556 [Alosa sapidissima]|uniref:uncharacterized protein LOC121719556 n=1 Tax=Alosa sapidissima TaxID=34773 RepID=UPI001C09356A|nr:uncharacterized protein LOC121719556 [Alosa sapidissima]